MSLTRFGSANAIKEGALRMVKVTGDQDLKTVLLLRLCAGFPVLALLFGSPDEILLHRDWGRTPSPLVRMATQILLLAASKPFRHTRCHVRGLGGRWTI